MKTYRMYRYIPYKYKKVRRNRILALLTAAFIAITGGTTLSKNTSNAVSKPKATQEEPVKVFPTLAPEITIEPTAEPTIAPTPEPTVEPINVKDGFNMGDSVITTDTVNMRLNTSTKSYKMGSIPKGTTVDRILTKDGFDLVRYNGHLAFVSTDFTNDNIEDVYDEYYKVEEYNDIVYTKTELNFRTGPSTNESKICLLDKNEELVVIGKVNVNDSGDIWYLVRARGEIGFVSASYTKSLRSDIMKMDPNIDEVIIKKFAYLTSSGTVYDQNGKKKFNLDQYQLVEVLAEYDNTYLITIDGKVGYIYKNDVKQMAGSFVAVDISTQRIYYYVRTDVAYRERCTTGADATPTKPGLYYPNVEKTGHRFTDEHSAHILWRAWGLEGLHDAEWEPEECFGDPEYRKRHGSLGCVRLPDSVAWHFRTEVPKNLGILIKK